jgi:hypothetical protein
MSPITIPESGLEFGPFDDDKCFYVEKSALYASLGEGVKMVEFLLVRPGRNGTVNLLCVEAKTSNPREENQPRFNEYCSEIRDKMYNALLLFLGAQLGRHGNAADELPEGLRTLDLQTAGVRFVLVVSSAKPDWLTQLQNKMVHVMQPLAKTFNTGPNSVAVLDADRARARGLIT